MRDTAENDLFMRVAHGDTDAFNEVYERFAGAMFSLALRILRDGPAAEDVVQETFVQIWEKAAAYNPKLGKPMTWAVTLVRNRAIDRLRTSARRQKLAEVATNESDPTQPVLPCPDQAVIGSETVGQVQAALRQIPADQRQAIEMAFFGGLTQTEIATALNVPLGTVKARIRRGMLQLREFLDVT
jgi:RNA polymerase sigma-70 factor, ECF subfamily